MAATALTTPALVLEFPRDLSAFTRDAIEALIERLIGTLDAIDLDADFEPDTDGEPSFGGYEGGDEREGDDSDREPTLAWTDEEAQRGRYAEQWPLDGEIDDVPILGFAS